MLRFKITTQPTIEPLTAAEAMAHCRETDTTLESKFESLITSAREYAETVTGRALAVKTVTAVCDFFPASGVIELPIVPIVTLTSLTYKNEDGDETDISNRVIVDDYSNPPKLVLKESSTWPTETLYQVNPIKIVYQAGETPSHKIKQAMLLLVGHWYENREEVVVGQESFTVPFDAEAILQQERHPYT